MSDAKVNHDFFNGFATANYFTQRIPFEMACIWCLGKFNNTCKARAHMLFSACNQYMRGTDLEKRLTLDKFFYLMNRHDSSIVSAPPWFVRLHNNDYQLLG